MGSKGSKIILKWILIGASLSYFIFHPFVMVIGYLMREANLPHDHSTSKIIVAEILMSFSLKMLSWALGFAVFEALVGFIF